MSRRSRRDTTSRSLTSAQPAPTHFRPRCRASRCLADCNIPAHPTGIPIPRIGITGSLESAEPTSTRQPLSSVPASASSTTTHSKLLIGTGFSQTTSYNNYVTSAPVNPISAPFPAGVLLPTGSSLGLSTAVGQGVSFIDPHHVQPKVAQYSASVQQQFMGNYVLSIAYFGSRASRVEVNHNINVLPKQYYDQGSAEITYLNAAVPNPMAGQIPQSTTLNAPTIARNRLVPAVPGVRERHRTVFLHRKHALQRPAGAGRKTHEEPLFATSQLYLGQADAPHQLPQPL